MCLTRYDNHFVIIVDDTLIAIFFSKEALILWGENGVAMSQMVMTINSDLLLIEARSKFFVTLNVQACHGR